MKTYKTLILGLSALLMASCSETLFEDIDKAEIKVETNENVSYNGNILTVKKGTPVLFNVTGDPDYVTFFSGELGHEYAYINVGEYDPKDVESVKLSFKLWSAYGYYDKGVQGRLKVYYSLGDAAEGGFAGLKKDNFEEDSVAVESYGWKQLTCDEELITPSTHGKVKEAGEFSKEIPAEWFNKKITLAIVRNPQKQALGETYVNSKTGEEETALQSSFNFEEMKIVAKLKNGKTTETYASTFGFTPLNMTYKKNFEDLDKNQFDLPANLAYGSTQRDVSGYCNMSAVGSGGFSIRGCAVNNEWRYTWLVSDYINVLNRPVRDSGVLVKELSQSAERYSYVYEQVGTYKATFLIRNANYDDEKQKLQEFVINVVE